MAISFYFDFASPYAYFASRQIDDLAKEANRLIEWRPILLWAVFKAQQIAPPMDLPVKRAYFLHDMARSARFYGIPYQEPAKMPVSSHLAARLFYFIQERDPAASIVYARRVFDAFFVEGRDISDELTMIEIAGETGLSAGQIEDGMKGASARAMLEQAVGQAIADDVIGSPYFVVDGEKFFGVDRLPQLRWFLSGEQK